MAAYQTGRMSDPSVLNTNAITQRLNNFTTETAGVDKSIGYLDIFVHQARDINNVCIYHKQDVYAKLCLTSDPEVSCSTQVINGGGRNPVFDEALKLDVRTVEASLKCEVWMLSRVRNYLEDQLLGFTVVPLVDILVADGKLAQEFSMSSTDLFHTPAGFVRLSLSYIGSSPDVIEISSPEKSASAVTDSGNDNLDAAEIEKIEFPDLNMARENETMVSKYFEMETLETYENLVKAENSKLLQNDVVIPGPEISTVNPEECPDESSCVSTADPQSVSEPSETAAAASSSEIQREKSQNVTDGEADSSEAPPPKDELVQTSVIGVNLQPGESVVQQDIVDMYMKSMQQFTNSLAKMKLPFDVVENITSPSADDSTDSITAEKSSPSKGSRVFYGSRAFF
ncbi:uncharacterized protein [Lolium perenne]|uniref:uncharacterized protein n=1 Tax=Lolium perenne TaxID=4522 RepID=UPI0021EAB523|nr:uncharacterized protein LOC127297085 [Lolium perenne]